MTLQYTTHNRASRLVYNSPKSSNIVCCIPVSISFQSAMTALKQLATEIRLPFFGVDVMTAAASLRGVGRWNKNNRNSSQDSFIGNKHSELVERPIVCFSPLSFIARLGIQRLTNIGQIFKRQCRTYYLSFVYQLSANAVVDIFLKPRFSPREPLEKSSRPTSAFGLKRCSDSGIAVASSLQLATVPSLVGGSCCNVSPSQIYTNHFGSFTRWWSVKFNRNLDVIVSTSSLDQRGTGGSLPPEQCQLVITNRQREPTSLRHQCDAYVLVGLPISENSSVQRNARWTKFVNLLHRLHVAYHSTNSLTDVVGFQPSCHPNRIVGQVMQFGCVPAVLPLGYLQYLIASISKSLQSVVNLLAQPYRDLELTGYRYGLGHASTILHPCYFWKALYPAPPSSLPTKGQGGRREDLYEITVSKR